MGNTSYAGGKSAIECNSFIIVLHLGGATGCAPFTIAESSGHLRSKYIKMGADFCEETDFVNSIMSMHGGGDAASNYTNGAGIDKQTYKG